jgi:hypothetical protein
MDSCEEVNGLVADYVEGDLPDDTRMLVKRHLAVCTDCSLFLTGYHKVIEWAGKLGSPQMPKALEKKLLRILTNGNEVLQ